MKRIRIAGVTFTAKEIVRVNRMWDELMYATIACTKFPKAYKKFKKALEAAEKISLKAEKENRYDKG